MFHESFHHTSKNDNNYNGRRGSVSQNVYLQYYPEQYFPCPQPCPPCPQPCPQPCPPCPQPCPPFPCQNPNQVFKPRPIPCLPPCPQLCPPNPCLPQPNPCFPTNNCQKQYNQLGQLGQLGIEIFSNTGITAGNSVQLYGSTNPSQNVIVATTALSDTCNINFSQYTFVLCQGTYIIKYYTVASATATGTLTITDSLNSGLQLPSIPVSTTVLTNEQTISYNIPNNQIFLLNLGYSSSTSGATATIYQLTIVIQKIC